MSSALQLERLSTTPGFSGWLPQQRTTELAPVKQERAVLQAALDTVETELKLIEDSTNRAKERLESSEEELAALDDNQNEKRSTLKSKEKELDSSKTEIVSLEQEDKELAAKEFKARYLLTDDVRIDGQAMEEIFAPYKTVDTQ